VTIKADLSTCDLKVLDFLEKNPHGVSKKAIKTKMGRTNFPMLSHRAVILSRDIITVLYLINCMPGIPDEYY